MAMATAESPETPFHFFKIVRLSALQDKKLEIPKSFVKKFGNDLSTVATLTVPNGSLWKVGLKKDGRKFWFHDGWHHFVEYHSISTGYFLLFKYGKNSNFHVLIFDMSACEIQYPHYHAGLKNDNQESILQQDELPDDNSDEIIGSLTPKPRAVDFTFEINSCRKSTASLDCPKFKRNYEVQGKRCKMDEAVEIDKSNSTDERELLAILEEMGIYVNRNFRNIAAKEKRRAIAAAKLFRPKNPSFMVLLQLRNTSKGFLYVPSQFAKNYLICGHANLIKLQDRDGREWSVKFRSNTLKSHGDISHGWTVFVKDNNLKNGDICIFELIREKNIVLKVSVFRSSTTTL